MQMELRKIEITTDTTIYIGHHGSPPCGMAMEEFLAVLVDRKGHQLTLKMKQCPVCGKSTCAGTNIKSSGVR